MSIGGSDTGLLKSGKDYGKRNHSLGDCGVEEPTFPYPFVNFPFEYILYSCQENNEESEKR